MNQRILNISGLQLVNIEPRGKASSCTSYTVTGVPGGVQYHPFPEHTAGVFYYRQSDTSPMRLGELRFRLCSDLETFGRGNDLLLPSGQPWHVSSHSLHFNDNLKSMWEHLVDEGLVEHDLYPGVPDSALTAGVTPLTSLSQPFVMDMSTSGFWLRLISPNSQTAPVNTQVRWMFRKFTNATEVLFSGESLCSTYSCFVIHKAYRTRRC